MSVRQYSMTNMTVGEGFVNNPNRYYLEEFFDKKPYVNSLVHSAITERGTINTNTTTKTSLSSITIPANSLIAGDVIHIQGVGKVISDNLADTSTVVLEFGSTNNTGGNVIITTPALNVTAGDDIHVDAYITIRTIGSGGTCIGNGQIRYDVGGSAVVNNITSEISIDTTVVNYISMNNTWSAAHVDNQIAADTFTMDLIHPNGTTPCEHLEIEGTNAINTNVTYHTTNTGIQIQTAGADQDQVIIIPHSDTAQTAWNNTKWYPNKQTEWECSLTTGSSIADVKIWAGLKETSDQLLATDDDQAYFKFQTDGDNSEAFTTFANLHFVYSVGGTDYISDLGIAVAADTTYHLRIVIDSDYKATIFVNQTQYSLTSTAGSTGGTTTGAGTTKSLALTPTADLKPYIGIEAGADAQKDISVHFQKISRVV